MNSRQIVSTAIMFIGLGATLFGGYVSTLMLLRPTDYHRYLNRSMWQASDPDPNYKWGAGTVFGTRVAAVFLMALCLFFALWFGAALLRGTQISFPAQRSLPSKGGAAPTHLLILGLGLLVAGLSILLRTESFVRWSVRVFAKRIIRTEAIPRASLTARFMACLMIFGGLDNVVTWLRLAI